MTDLSVWSDEETRPRRRRRRRKKNGRGKGALAVVIVAAAGRWRPRRGRRARHRAACTSSRTPSPSSSAPDYPGPGQGEVRDRGEVRADRRRRRPDPEGRGRGQEQPGLRRGRQRRPGRVQAPARLLPAAAQDARRRRPGRRCSTRRRGSRPGSRCRRGCGWTRPSAARQGDQAAARGLREGAQEAGRRARPARLRRRTTRRASCTRRPTTCSRTRPSTTCSSSCSRPTRPPPRRPAWSAPSATPEEIVIIASLVEAEARNAEDFGKVARVVYNRLEQGMPLQFDSTVNYALKADKQIVTYEDLERRLAVQHLQAHRPAAGADQLARAGGADRGRQPDRRATGCTSSPPTPRRARRSSPATTRSSCSSRTSSSRTSDGRPGAPGRRARVADRALAVAGAAPGGVRRTSGWSAGPTTRTTWPRPAWPASWRAGRVLGRAVADHAAQGGRAAAARRRVAEWSRRWAARTPCCSRDGRRVGENTDVPGMVGGPGGARGRPGRPGRRARRGRDRPRPRWRRWRRWPTRSGAYVRDPARRRA